MKKIIVCLIIALILPITINALEIDKDLNSGIILSGDESVVPKDTVLSVKNASSNSIDSLAKTFGLTKYNAYNISLLNEAKRIVPTGEVTLSFPISDSYNSNIPKQIFILKLVTNNIDIVYTADQDTIGLYEDLTIKDGFAIIDTSSFSLNNDTTYLIGTTANISTKNYRSLPNEKNVDNPETIDKNLTPFLIISIIGIGGVMLLFTKLYLDNK